MRRFILSVSLCSLLLVAAAPPPKPASRELSYAMFYNPNRALRDETIPLRIEHALMKPGFQKVKDTLLIQYGALGKDRKAQGVSVMMTPMGLNNANNHWVDGRIDPPGWKDDAGMTRLMLLPYNLAGHGTFARNLVAVNRAEVVPKYTVVMNRIRHAVEKQKKTVNFSITPVYRGVGMPTSIMVTADIPLDGEKKWVAFDNAPPVKPAIQASDLTRLKRILPPPRRPIATGSVRQWQEAEKRLELTFPDDYKQFITTYGGGTINDFVQVYNPFATGDHVNFEDQLRWMKKLNPNDTRDFPYPPWPAKDGMVPLGSTTDGGSIYWRARGNPDEWTIIVYDRGWGYWREFPCGWTAFLRRALEQDIQIRSWSPDSFQPKFVASKPK